MEGMIHHNSKLGTVAHTTERTIYEGDRLQTDSLKAVLPLDALAPDGIEQLAYWRVEAFDSAYIDWEHRQIVFGYSTEHFLPRDYIPED